MGDPAPAKGSGGRSHRSRGRAAGTDEARRGGASRPSASRLHNATGVNPAVLETVTPSRSPTYRRHRAALKAYPGPDDGYVLTAEEFLGLDVADGRDGGNSDGDGSDADGEDRRGNQSVSGEVSFESASPGWGSGRASRHQSPDPLRSPGDVSWVDDLRQLSRSPPPRNTSSMLATTAPVPDPAGSPNPHQSPATGTAPDPVMTPLSLHTPGMGGTPNSYSRAHVPSALTASIRDQAILAKSMQRAGNTFQEGLAHLNRGLLYDEQGDLRSAIGSYRRYVRLFLGGGVPVVWLDWMIGSGAR